MNEQLPRCPLCKSDFHYRHLDLTMPFRCPVCEKWIRVANSRWYATSGMLVAVLITGFICFEFGARGPTLFLYTLVLWFPVFFLVVFWKMHFAPPRLKPSEQPPDSSVLGLNRE